MLDPQTAQRLQDPDEFLPRDYSTMPQGSLLREYVSVLSLLDAIADVEKKLSTIRNAMKDDFIRRSIAEGVEKFSGQGISVTVKDKTTVKYDPERWDTIVKELVEKGHGYCLYRQLSVSKVQALMDAGERLPEGLSLDSSLKEVSHRRG